MMEEVLKLVRNNILHLKPYSCARNEFTGEASVFIDANENPVNSPYNRYPDPLQTALKAKIAEIKHVRPSQIVLGVGSDEPIDLVMRIFCEPKEDNLVAIDPTYAMYEVCAGINNVEYRKVPLREDFSFDAEAVLARTDAHTKVVFLCSPNNPTGNLLQRDEIIKILDGFHGITVIDEAYIDFSAEPSWLGVLDRYPRLIVLQTFSKAWGLASVRCGMAFASEEIVTLYNKVKYPYNLNLLTQELVRGQIEQEERKNGWVRRILDGREWLAAELRALPVVEKVYPSDANFLLVKVEDATAVYRYLIERGIVVRNRNGVTLCDGCLRITVGSEAENMKLTETLKKY